MGLKSMLQKKELKEILKPILDVYKRQVSLRQAQKNYIEFGACEKEMLCHVRKPTVYDRKDENWNVLYKEEGV